MTDPILVSTTPAHMATNHNPADWAEWVVSKESDHTWFFSISFLSFTAGGGLVWDGSTVSAGWDFESVPADLGAIDGTTSYDEITIRVRPTGGWQPNANYGEGGVGSAVDYISALSIYVLTPGSALQLLTVTVPLFSTGAAAVEITTESLPSSIRGDAYAETVEAIGDSSFTFEILSGALPDGLVIDENTGEITGENGANPGTYYFTVRATGGTSGLTDTRELSIEILPSVTIVTETLPNAIEETPYSTMIEVYGGTAPYTFSVLSGSLPAGLSLDADTGEISGVATTPGSSTFTVNVVDDVVRNSTREFTLTVESFTGTPTEIVRTELSAADVAALDDDLPILLARNAAASYVRAAEWRTSGAWGSGADITDRLRPTVLAYDGDHHAGTRPRPHTGSAVDYLIFDLRRLTFDTIVLIGNFDELGGVVGVRVEIANDEDFTTDLETLASWTTNLDRRLVSTTLGYGNPGVTVGASYAGVRYLRVRIAYDGNAPHPEIRELFLWRRRSIPYRPNVPWDEGQTEGMLEALETIGGDDHTISRYRGRLVLAATWDPVDTDELEELFRGWWADCGYGTEPWGWLPRPDSRPRAAYVMGSSSPELVIEHYENPGLRRVRVLGLERSPFVAREEGEL